MQSKRKRTPEEIDAHNRKVEGMKRFKAAYDKAEKEGRIKKHTYKDFTVSSFS